MTFLISEPLSGLQKERVVLVGVDVLGSSDWRRIWSAEEKVEVLAEIDSESGKVRLVPAVQRTRISAL